NASPSCSRISCNMVPLSSADVYSKIMVGDTFLKKLLINSAPHPPVRATSPKSTTAANAGDGSLIRLEQGDLENVMTEKFLLSRSGKKKSRSRKRFLLSNALAIRR